MRYLVFDPNKIHLTATYKTNEEEVNIISLILNKKFVGDKRDSIKTDFTKFIIENIMEKYENDDVCDADLLVVYPEDPTHPIHAQ